ncbi:MAG: TlpA disulfide reductase family protein [Candidatus Omnitrophica bacterium]|nr:TlpA disulfide reductase family protein [Candidatus Omnitrophota bacterium]MDD5574088.1 TlpA disulfide reductase family protein [Candidatus Omnitrophota bacterium]
MKRHMVRWFLSAVMMVAFCGAHDVSASASIGQARLVGSAASDFSLETTADSKVTLGDLKGKGVILFFFTTWCPYCREKLPFLAKEYNAMRAKKIELLPIDAGESKTKVKAFADKQSLPFPILLDTDTAVAEAYGVVGVPTFFLISREGKVVWTGNELPDDYETYLTS